MGFRVHRSIKLFPGLRLNLSKSGVGFSTGVKGYHVSRMANGRTRRTISIPGTGLSWVDQTSSRSSTPRAATQPSGPTPIFTPDRPGWSAPHDEKALHDAFVNRDVAQMLVVAQGSSPVELAACTLAGIFLIQAGRNDEALGYLQRVFDSRTDPAKDPFIAKYSQMVITVEVVDGASSTLPIDRTTVGLLLAELLQRRGDSAGAIAVVEALEPSTLTALSLAELYVDTGAFDEVVAVTNNAPNEDDATSMLWIFRGIAFREQQNFDAARECFAKVIRCTSRHPIVLHRARFERARCYEAEGKTAMAKKELVRIQTEDPTYEGLDAAIAELDGRP